MSDIRLRPHHALCIRFFEGKGYSEGFVRHMAEVIDRLRREQPTVTLTDGCDVLCAACPHNLQGICDTDEKVRAIDDRVLALTGLTRGDRIGWDALYDKTGAAIVHGGRLSEVCRDCRWAELCLSKTSVDKAGEK